MLVLVSTAREAVERDQLVRRAENRMCSVLRRFEEIVTAVDVHLEEVSTAQLGTNEKRCLIEVRLSGHDPEVAMHSASTFEDAICGASLIIRRRLDSTIGDGKLQRAARTSKCRKL